MTQQGDTVLRKQLVETLSGKQAHLDFPAAIADFPVTKAGSKPERAPHSAWEILEHLRITQRDILDFCIGTGYKPLQWPKDYWPASETPASERAWSDSVASFDRDLEALKKLAEDPQKDLFSPLPHGEGQTLLRELLLVADHNSHHLGQFLFLKKMLGKLH